METIEQTIQIRLYIQCKAPDGEIGSFLKEENGNLVSPFFRDCYDLFKWNNAQKEPINYKFPGEK